MITSSFYPHLGGGEQQALRLSQKLIQRGWNVRVITRRHNPQYPYLPSAFEQHQGVPVHRVFSPGPGKIGSLLFMLSSLVFLALRGRKGIYHAHGIGAPATIAVWAARLFGDMSLVKLRTGVEVYRNVRQSGFSRGFAFMLRGADYLIAVNREVGEELRAWGVSSKRIGELPNAIDTDQFMPCEDKEAARLCLFPSANGWRKKTWFLYVGRLSPAKGVDVLLSAWAKLPLQICDESLLLIVGDGAEKASLMAQCKQLGVDSSVKFLGRREEVFDFYQAADVVVLPSRWEGLSNVMLEAMACGLPVICTAVGGAVDWLENKKNGVLVPSEDVYAMRHAMLWVTENRDSWHRLGKSARETVVDSLSMDVVIKRLERLYSYES